MHAARCELAALRVALPATPKLLKLQATTRAYRKRVARNEARLRVTVSASHSSDDLQALLESLAR